jgi:hypothetical protein
MCLKRKKLYDAAREGDLKKVKELTRVTYIKLDEFNPFYISSLKIKVYLTRVLVRRSKKNLLRKLNIFKFLEKHLPKDVVEHEIVKYI